MKSRQERLTQFIKEIDIRLAEIEEQERRKNRFVKFLETVVGFRTPHGERYYKPRFNWITWKVE